MTFVASSKPWPVFVNVLLPTAVNSVFFVLKCIFVSYLIVFPIQRPNNLLGWSEYWCVVTFFWHTIRIVLFFSTFSSNARLKTSDVYESPDTSNPGLVANVVNWLSSLSKGLRSTTQLGSRINFWFIPPCVVRVIIVSDAPILRRLNLLMSKYWIEYRSLCFSGARFALPSLYITVSPSAKPWLFMVMVLSPMFTSDALTYGIPIKRWLCPPSLLIVTVLPAEDSINIFRSENLPDVKYGYVFLSVVVISLVMSLAVFNFLFATIVAVAPLPPIATPLFMPSSSILVSEIFSKASGISERAPFFTSAASLKVNSKWLVLPGMCAMSTMMVLFCL